MQNRRKPLGKPIKITKALNTEKTHSISDSFSSSSKRESLLLKNKIGSISKNEKKLRLNLNPTTYTTRSTSTDLLSVMMKTSRDTTHSIFSRFHNDFTKNFNDNINKTIASMNLTAKRYPPRIFLKKHGVLRQNNTPKLTLKTENQTQEESKEESETESKKQEKIKLGLDDETTTTKPPSKTFTEPSKIDFDSKGYRRIRCFKKYKTEKYIMNQKWKIELSIARYDNKFNDYLIKDIDFQYNFVKDELSILMDNIQYMKSGILSSNNIVPAFGNKDVRFQVNLNKVIEETCALLSLIPSYILNEYNNYTDRFIAVDPPIPQDFFTREVYEESETFVENIRLFVKIANFTKCVFEVYLILVKQVDEEMKISTKKFLVLKEILERCRYNTNEILNSLKSALKDLAFDRNLIKKYHDLLKKDNISLLDVEKLYLRQEQEEMGEHIKNQLNFEKNEIKQKLQRIKKALAEEKEEKMPSIPLPKKMKKKYTTKMKEAYPPMGCINSELMTKLLKYCHKDVREKIISVRTIERIQKASSNV